MGYEIVFSAQAQHDLREIEYYISFDSPQVAKRFGQQLIKKTDMLGLHPEIGRIVPEVGNRIVREIIVGNYRIMYRVNVSKKQVRILSYWHAARGTPDVRY
ncbi:MAG: hypothetical protein A3F67_03385 [Verrucomicrobia bacterium RIFCSPHIGHO2_12_FULL_41_10]|nr:MAG: hypothetical protein A3F67_03385 [Verrucomicrobia bacterium RIFCSPHIGHO2_12_FULL_41_10]HLB34851.1 type II toxin-antitoxin system RelE/ParE family toxin [Chthoniobacterales bacterium]